MTPAVLVMSVCWKICDFCKNAYHRVRIKRILKKNPDINELSKLSGIKK
jgi:hypothetical protein